MVGEVTSVAQGTPPRLVDGGALDPLVGPQCSLAVQLRRTTGGVIGRSAELDAISQELKQAASGLAAVTLEGEPGIGKTRLLLAAGATCHITLNQFSQALGSYQQARKFCEEHGMPLLVTQADYNIAYLYFLKDFSRYVPIAPNYFDQAFEMLGVVFVTSHKCSWVNYSTYGSSDKYCNKRA
jgi:hypothetical protein